MTSDKITDAINNADPSDWVKLSDIPEDRLVNIQGVFKSVGENTNLAFTSDRLHAISAKYDVAEFYTGDTFIQVHGLDNVQVYMPKTYSVDFPQPGEIVYNVESTDGKVYYPMLVTKDSLIGVDSEGNPVTLPKSDVKSIRSRY